MKLILILTLFCSILIITNAAKSKLKTQEYLDLFRIANGNMRGYKARQEPTEKPAETGDAATSGEAASGDAAAGGAAGGLLQEGWLRIAYQNFPSQNEVPAIPYGQDKKSQLQIVENQADKNVDASQLAFGVSQDGYFRKNMQYKEGGEIPTRDSFYFRLSGTNLYFTETKADMIVLGAIAVKNFGGSQNSQLGAVCFEISNQEGDQWNLCAKDTKSKQEWMCGISKSLGQPCGNEEPNQAVIIEEKTKQKEPQMIIPIPSPYCNEKWNYNEGGKDWNCKCAEGYFQSPVALNSKCTENQLSTPVNFNFNSVSQKLLSLVYENNILRVKCTESECDSINFGTIVDYNMTEYESREILIHTPGEHMIDNEIPDMEVQVVFNAITEGDYRKKAVLAIPIKQKAGGRNKFFDSIELLNLPNAYQTKTTFSSEQEKSISIEDLFLKDDQDTFSGYFSYYFYQGSLTSPPCDEDVSYFVSNKKVETSLTAIEMIKEVLNAPALNSVNTSPQANNNPDGNARKAQDLNGRKVQYFDSKNCEFMPQMQKFQDEGHYEKVERKATTYIYVPTSKPSGIPDALVVSENEAKNIKVNRDENGNIVDQKNQQSWQQN